jgi:thioredoxin reductase (NADPH)
MKTTHTVDFLIIGSGPAGLAAAQYGARAALRVIVLEQLATGGQALLIDALENYPGLIPALPGFEFAENMRKQAEQFGASFMSEAVKSVEKTGAADSAYFTVTLESGAQLTAPAILIATGARRRKLGVPGEETFAGRGVSYCATCDGPFFKGKRIFVVGGGDTACDEAQYLSRLSPNVILAHRRAEFRAQKSIAARVQSNPRIETRLDTRLLEIRGDQKVTSVILESDGLRHEEAADAVFIFVGSEPETAVLPSFVEVDAQGYIVTDQAMATSVSGLFAAGDVRATPFRQVVVAAAEGAIAAHSAAAYIDDVCTR